MFFGKENNYTLIARFDDLGYAKLKSVLGQIDEKVSRVPYCRVPDSERYSVDNLPYHVTVSSSKQTQKKILETLNPLQFNEFEIVVDSIRIMNGRKNSQVLYLGIQHSDELDDLQMKAYDCLHNDNYLPGKNTPHITIAISRDQEKIRRIKSAIEKDFEPFVLRVKSLGLYKIWPGELVKEYNQYM